jgi:hypothetical protein
VSGRQVWNALPPYKRGKLSAAEIEWSLMAFEYSYRAFPIY